MEYTSVIRDVTSALVTGQVYAQLW